MVTVPSTGKTRTPTTLCSFAFRVMKSPEDDLLSAPPGSHQTCLSTSSLPLVTWEGQGGSLQP